MENTVAHAFISEPNLTLHPSIYRRFGHSMPHIASVQVFFFNFYRQAFDIWHRLDRALQHLLSFSATHQQHWKRPISRAMGDFAPTPQRYGGILRPPLGFCPYPWDFCPYPGILRLPWDFAHAPQVLPPPLRAVGDSALRAMPSELCPLSYALRAMPTEPCPQSYAHRAMGDFTPTPTQSHALRAMGDFTDLLQYCLQQSARLARRISYKYDEYKRVRMQYKIIYKQMCV